jgi:predicted DNA-binding WGR domain protein
MSSLSRKYARASKRGLKLMEQYQPSGAYQEAEKQYNEKLNEKRDRKLEGR